MQPKIMTWKNLVPSEELLRTYLRIIAENVTIDDNPEVKISLSRKIKCDFKSERINNVLTVSNSKLSGDLVGIQVTKVDLQASGEYVPFIKGI
uniref:Uncharacterized protein n=2 Tax=Lepeophtheirus salmonis TaxID=72036 RepID=A0A0K2TRT5_LEPSM